MHSFIENCMFYNGSSKIFFTLKIRFHYNSCCDKIFYGEVLNTLRVMKGVPHGVIIKNLFTVAVANSTVAIFGNAWHDSDRSQFLFKLGSWFKLLYCVSLGQDSLIIINVLSLKDYSITIILVIYELMVCFQTLKNNFYLFKTFNLSNTLFIFSWQSLIKCQAKREWVTSRSHESIIKRIKLNNQRQENAKIVSTWQ